ncbi:hypothetical protein GYMLUDRAFT_264791 [Collybiopsis luxurians FD-317 M1]|uniref:Uncharacterized protein n=1 Tax=Collybiopsis luxurians FD-317 M1 TaxID=944289 RepID=A0A0D0BWS4_9AGAR|nr:hypothetical protein GYMLUDRAFT_264791 [Collybiopsis luxurians FD-317 M1]
MFPHLLGQLAKWFLGLLLVLNIRAFPFVWHVRVFRPLIYIWLSQLALKLKSMFMSKSAKVKAFERWVDSLTPIGKSPFQETVFRSWASIDESDYNFHLSNSSYAKALDGARFKLAAQLLPKFLVARGVIPLAGTHFHFIREIPILAKYEIRITLEAWDEKWIYIVCRFVSRGKKGKSKTKKPISTSPDKKGDIVSDTDTGTSTPASNPSFFHAPVNSSGVSMSSTPLSTDGAPTDMDKLTSKLLANADYEEPDGATLHTITVSQMCFKMGRITIPPAIVFALNGLSVPPSPPNSEGDAKTNSTSAVKEYSHANPPPHWQKVNEIASRLHGGSIKKLQAFLRGGWKDVSKEERWWEQAMGGAVEERRRRNLERLELLRRGMEGARGGMVRWG